MHRPLQSWRWILSAVACVLLIGAWPQAAQGAREVAAPPEAPAGARAVLSPDCDAHPAVTLDLPATAFIGESFDFTVAFDNIGTANGYAPYVDLFLPTSGPDDHASGGPYDGLTFSGSDHLGNPVHLTPMEFPAGGTLVHPLTGQTITAPAGFGQGDVLVVLELPFISFTPGQPAAVTTISVDMSNFADLDTPLTVLARPFFRLGCDALGSDMGYVPGTAQSDAVTPIVVTMEKIYHGPEGETATGPNYPRQYTINVDIADGQPVEDLEITDLLPPNAQFLRVISSTPAGATVLQSPVLGAAQNPPDNDLVVQWPVWITGAPGVDATLTFEFFIPEFDADGNPVLDPLTGACRDSINDAKVAGTWDPLDPRDPLTPFVLDETPSDFVLEICALVIQKSAAIVNDVPPVGPSPNDVVQYTYSYQVSDYYTEGGPNRSEGPGSPVPPGPSFSIVITDTVSDGQLFDSTFAPTYSVGDRDGMVSGSFTYGANFAPYTNLVIDDSEQLAGIYPPPNCIQGACACASTAPNPLSGLTVLTFDLSQQMIDDGDTGSVPIIDGQADMNEDGAITAADVGTLRGYAIIGGLFDIDGDGNGTVPDGNDDLDASVFGHVIINGYLDTNNDLFTPDDGDDLAALTFPSPILIGGCIDEHGDPLHPCPWDLLQNGDQAPFNPGPPPYGATTGTLVYQTVIQDRYSCLTPSGDYTVDQGDRVSNDVYIRADVLDNNDPDLPPTGRLTAGEDSAAGLSMVTGTLYKSVYARNGVIGDSGPFVAGDRITYRIAYDHPTSDVDDFQFVDFLPLPVLQVDDYDADNAKPDAPAWNFYLPPSQAAGSPPVTIGGGVVAGGVVQCNTADDLPQANYLPAPGQVTFGPADTFHCHPGPGTPALPPNPAVSMDAGQNSLAMAYYDYDNTLNAGSTMELLFTLVVQDDPFDDRAFLTNQVRSIEGNSFNEPTIQDVIVQFELYEPLLGITKGVVSHYNPWINGPSPNVVFTPSPPAPVPFSPAPGTPCPAFPGTITSASLDTTPINSNLSNAEPDDTVRFAIVVENTGSSQPGAFDVVIKDDVPLGYGIPAGGINLCVTYGDGTLIPYTAVNGADPLPLFGAGIELYDPEVIKGYVDIDGDHNAGGAPDPNDDGWIAGMPIINGYVDLDRDGTVYEADDTGVFLGYLIQSGLVDIDGNLIINTNDHGPFAGALGPYSTSPGTTPPPPDPRGHDLAIVTFMLRITVGAVTGTGTNNAPLVNTATLDSYSSVEGGEDFLDQPLTDPAQVQPVGPVLTLRKSAVGTNSASTLLDYDPDQPNPAGITWAGPGAACPSHFAGTVTGQLGQPGNLYNVEVGDRVRFAIVVQNTGPGINGAFDVVIRDDLPAGYAVPAGGINLCVTDGTRAPISYLRPNGTAAVPNDLFGVGLQLLDPGPTAPDPGAIDRYSTTSGRNIAVLTFELQAVATDPRVTSMTNTARVASAEAAVDGPDVIATDLTDQARVNLLLPAVGISKGVVSTNSPDAAFNPVPVGPTSFSVPPESGCPRFATEINSTNLAANPVNSNLVGADVGDLVTFAIVVENTGQTTGGAFDVQIADTIPAGFVAPPTGFNICVTNGRKEPVLWTAINSGDPTPLFGAGIELYDPAVIDERIDLDGDGAANGSDDGTLRGVQIIDGYVDIAAPFGAITTADDGTFLGETIVDGYVDLEGDGQDGDDDGPFAGALGSLGDAGGSNILVITYDLQVHATAPQPGDMVNVASVLQFTDIDDAPTLGSDEDDAIVTIVGVSDLRIQKFGKPDGEVRAGDVLVYTIVVDNLGPDPASDVSMAEVLGSDGTFDLIDILSDRAAECVGVPGPALQTIPASPWPPATPVPPTGVNPPTGVAGIFQRLELHCTLIGSLEPIQPDGELNIGRWIVTLRVRANETQDINNLASVSSPNLDENPDNNEAFVEHDITDVADLAVDKSIAAASLVAGETTTYQIIVRNLGPSSAENVVVTDQIPPELKLLGIAVTPAGAGSCFAEPSGRLTCGLDTLAPGQVAYVNLTVEVKADVPPGTIIRNSAMASSDIFDPDNSNNQDTVPANVEAAADLVLAKRDSADPVTAGEAFQYIVDVTNNGPSDAEDVEVTDLLPAGVSYLGATVIGGEGGTCAFLAPATVRCALGTVPAEATVSVAIDVRVDPGTAPGPDVLNNTAYVTSSTEDAAPGNEQDEEPTTVVAEADLSIDKTAAAAAVPGQPLTYELTVTNDGPSDAQNVIVTDNLPPGATYVYDTDSCSGGLLGPLACSLGTIPAGGSVRFEVVAMLDPATPAGRLTNSATVTSDTPDPDPTDNEDTAQTLVTATADLKITKFGKPDGQVQAGEELVYTIIVENLGPGVAHNVVVQDEMVASGIFDIVSINGDVLGNQASEVCVPGGPATGVGPQVAVVCTLPQLPVNDAGRAGVWMIEVVVTADEPISLNNIASVDSDDADPNPGNNDAVVEREITASADLALTKTATPVPLVPGGPVTYQINVVNNGPSSAPDVVVVDQMPAGVSVTGATVAGGAGSCSWTPAGRVECRLGTLPAGGTRQITIVGTVDPGVPLGTVLANGALVTSDAYDPDGSDNSDSAPDPVLPLADLYLQKFASPTPAVAGEPVQYQLVVQNRGPSAAQNVQVVDSLPAGFLYQGATIAGGTGTCSLALLNQLTCDLGTLAPWQMVTITIDGVAAADLAQGTTLSNGAWVYSSTADPGPYPNDDSTDTPVTREADLSIAKRISGSGVPGENLVYTIAVTNHGPSDAANVQVADNLPPWVTYLYDTDACAGAPNLLCSLGTLPAGETVSFDVVVRVNAGAPAGLLTNLAAVGSDTPDPDPTDNEAEATIEIIPTSDLRILKFGKPDGQAQAGEELVYTILVDNLGPSAAMGVTVKDVLLSSGTFDLLDITSDLSFTCSSLPPGAPGAVPGIAGRLQVDCTLLQPLPPLSGLGGPPNAGRWILTMRVRAAEAQSLNNIASVLSDSLDPDPGNNQAIVEHEITAAADLSVVKTANPAQPVPGQQVTYVLTVANAGPSEAPDVVVIDQVPAGVSVTSVTVAGGPGSCSWTDAGRVECYLGTIAAPPGVNTRMITIVGAVDPGVPVGTVLMNGALVTSGAYDPDGSDNSASAGGPAAPMADLILAKAASPSPAVAGEPVQYRLTVYNPGPSAAQDVVVSDQLPAGFLFQGVTILGGSGTCAVSPANLLTCDLGTLPAGQAVILVIDGVAAADLPDPTTWTNTASVSSSTFDPQSWNNDAVVPIDIGREADLSAAKRVRGSGVPGENLTYTVDVTNHGPSDAENVVVTDTLPAGVTYLYDTDACTAVGQVLTCDLGNLAADQTASFEVVVRVNADAPAGVVNNVALVGSDTGDPDEENNDSGPAPIEIRPTADLFLRKFGKPDGEVRAGEELVYYLKVTNLGPSTALTGTVRLEDLLASDGQFTLVSVAPGAAATCTPTSGTFDQTANIVCTLNAPLAMNEEWALTMVVRADETQDLNNQAGVEFTGGLDPNPGNNYALVEHDITDVADLSIEKTGPATITAGESGQYTVTVENAGPSTAENVVVYDRLPPGIVVTGVTPSQGSCTTGTPGSAADRLTCNLGPLAADDPPATIEIDFEVDPALRPGTVLENDASVVSDIFDPNNGDNADNLLTTVEGASELTVSKVADPATVAAGGMVEYRIAATNNGPSTVHNVRFSDPFTANGEYLQYLGYAIVGGSGTCSYSASGGSVGAVTCALGDLAAGQTVEVVLQFAVDPATPDGTVIYNEVAWLTDSPADITGEIEAEVEVEALSRLSIVKTALDATPVPGGELAYRIDVTNAGPSVATAVQVTDTLDGDLTYLYSTSATCTAAGQNVTCALGDVAAGQTVSFEIVVAVDPDATGEVDNTAVATWDGGTTSDDETVNLDAVADLRILKFGKPDGEVRAGEELIYSLVVDNLGPSAAHNVIVSDTIVSSGQFTPPPPWNYYYSFPGASGGCAVLFSLTTYGQQTTLIRCDFDEIPPQGQVMIQFGVTADETQDINDVASVKSDDLDPDFSNNQALVEHDITDVADLSITKTGPGLLVAGEDGQYILTVGNDGPSTAENVIVYDRLPAGIVVTGVTPTQGSCTTGTPGSADDKLACNLGDIAPGGTAGITIDFTADPGLPAGAILENDAQVVSDIYDPDNSDNADNQLTEIRTASAVLVGKVDVPDPVRAGELLEYRLVLTNTGPAMARGVRLIDTLPTEGQLTLVGYHFLIGSGTCYQTADLARVECFVGDIPAGEYRVVTLRFAVDPSIADGTVLNNTLSASATSPGATFTGDLVEDTTVEAETDLGVVKTSWPVKVTAGEQKRYTITVTNYGPSQAVNVVATDTLPEGVTYEIDTGGCSVAGQAVTCALGTMAPGATTSFDIHALVLPSASGIITNTVVVASDTTETVLTNNTDFAENLALAGADLWVTKTDHPDPAVPGELLTYTLWIQNDGPSTAVNVVATDLLPPFVTYDDAASSAQCSEASPGVVECTLPSLAAGAHHVFIIVVEVDEDAPVGELYNQVRVRSDTRDPDTGNNSAGAGTSLASQADLAVDKSGPLQASAGESISYTLVIENQGSSAATNAVLYDRLPAGVTHAQVTVVPAGPACATGTPGQVDDPLTCGLGTLDPGERVTVTIYADILEDVADGTWLENDARVASDAIEADNSDNQDNVVTRIVATADLEIEKTATAAVVAGEELTYTLKVTNHGPATALNVRVQDMLPVGAEFLRGSPQCSLVDGRLVSCALGPVAAGQVIELTITARVESGTPAGTLTNQALATSDTTDPTLPNTDAADTLVSTAADLGIDKVGPAQAMAGDIIRYDLTVTNSGPSDAVSVKVTDTLPSGFAYRSDTDACLEGPIGTLSCSLGTIAAGGSRTFSIYAQINTDIGVDQAAAAFDKVNQAAVGSNTPDPNPANDQDVASTQVRTEADLSIVKLGDPSPAVVAGERLAYTLVVDNLGPAWALDVSVTDELDPAFDDTTLILPAICSYNPAMRLITCDLGDLADGQRMTLDISAEVLTDIVPPYNPINNRAEVQSAITPDPDLTNNVAEVVTDVAMFANLMVEKEGPPTVVAGGGLVYTLRVTNQGPSAAQNVVLEDRLPGGVTVTGTQASAGTCTTGTAGSAADQLTCGLGTLDAGASVAVTVTAVVDPGLPDGTVLENDAAATSDSFDPDNSDNRDHVLTDVTAVADLVLVKVDRPDPVVAGELLEYRLVITNTGPSVAREVTVSDTLPIELNALDVYLVNAPAATCAVGATPPQRVDCTLGDLAAGQRVEVVITTRVAPDVPSGTVLENNAAVSSTTTDPDESDNEGTSETTVQAYADLGIVKSVQPVKVYAGEQARYLLTVSNYGPSDVPGLVVTDLLPGGVAYEIDTNSCTLAGQQLTCTGGTLRAGQSWTFEIWVRVDPATLPGTVLENSACVAPPAGVIDPNTANDCATATSLVLGKADLRVFKFGKMDGEVRAGDNLTYTLIVDNLGPGYAHNVVITDLLQSSGTFRLVSVSSDRPATCTPQSGTFSERMLLTCRLADPLEVISPTASGRWIVTIVVTADQTQDINNIARAVSSDLDLDSSNNQAYVEHDITDVADLEIEKCLKTGIWHCDTDFLDWPRPGLAGVYRYRLTATNHGPSTAENVVITDRLPWGVTVTGIEHNGFNCGVTQPSVDDTVVTCGLDSLAPGESRSVILDILIDPSLPAGGYLANGACVSSDIYDPNSNNDCDYYLVKLRGVSALWIKKAGLPDPVYAGDVLEYYLEAGNDGPSTARTVTIWDGLPEQVFFQSVSVLNRADVLCSYSAAYHEVNCYLDTLLPGEKVKILLRVKVKPGTRGGTVLYNDAEARSATGSATTQATTLVQSKVNLTISKDGEPVKVYAGGQIRYTVKVNNTGPSDADNVVVTDELPAGVHLELAPKGCRLVDTDPDMIECGVGKLVDGASRSYEIWAVVDPATPAGTVLVNKACVEGESIGTDPLPDGACATTRNLVLGLADLKVRKFGKPDGQVVAGQYLTYTVIVDNLGPGYAHQVVLDDLLQSSGRFRLVRVESDRPATCSPTAGEFRERLELRCELNGALETVTPETSGRWLLTVIVVATEPQDINNVARVVAAEPDPDWSNNEAYAEQEVTQSADLEIVKTAAGLVTGSDGTLTELPNQAVPGGSVIYRLTVTNHGPSRADKVTVRDYLPAGITVVGATADGGRCNYGRPGDRSAPLTCNLGNLARGATATVTITATVPTGAAGGTVLTNEAWVSSEQFDPLNANDLDTNLTTVGAEADLSVTKVQEPAVVFYGQQVRYTVTVYNAGPNAVVGARLVDTFPAELADSTWQCVGLGGATCPQASGSLEIWQVFDLPAGGRLVYTVHGTVAARHTFSNTATVTLPEGIGDPDESNNTVTVTNWLYGYYVPISPKGYLP